MPQVPDIFQMRMQDKTNWDSQRKSVGEISDQHVEQLQGTVTRNTVLCWCLIRSYGHCEKKLYCTFEKRTQHLLLFPFLNCLPYSHFPGGCSWHLIHTLSLFFYIISKILSKYIIYVCLSQTFILSFGGKHKCVIF